MFFFLEFPERDLRRFTFREIELKFGALKFRNAEAAAADALLSLFLSFFHHNVFELNVGYGNGGPKKTIGFFNTLGWSNVSDIFKGMF